MIDAIRVGTGARSAGSGITSADHGPDSRSSTARRPDAALRGHPRRSTRAAGIVVVQEAFGVNASHRGRHPAGAPTPGTTQSRPTFFHRSGGGTVADYGQVRQGDRQVPGHLGRRGNPDRRRRGARPPTRRRASPTSRSASSASASAVGAVPRRVAARARRRGRLLRRRDRDRSLPAVPAAHRRSRVAARHRGSGCSATRTGRSRSKRSSSCAPRCSDTLGRQRVVRYAGSGPRLPLRPASRLQARRREGRVGRAHSPGSTPTSPVTRRRPLRGARSRRSTPPTPTTRTRSPRAATRNRRRSCTPSSSREWVRTPPARRRAKRSCSRRAAITSAAGRCRARRTPRVAAGYLRWRRDLHRNTRRSSARCSRDCGYDDATIDARAGARAQGGPRPRARRSRRAGARRRAVPRVPRDPVRRRRGPARPRHADRRAREDGAEDERGRHWRDRRVPARRPARSSAACSTSALARDAVQRYLDALPAHDWAASRPRLAARRRTASARTATSTTAATRTRAFLEADDRRARRATSSSSTGSSSTARSSPSS